MSGSETARSPVRTRVGRYEMLFRIAAGGMAEVYAARLVGEGGFEKLVAVKRMLPELASDERFVAMFLDEGRVAANVSSPYVVQTLDLGRAEDQSLFLVMELVHGISLSAMMQELGKDRALPPPIPIAAEILAQAAQGLHDAHEAKTTFGKALGIVHRDISPQNIMVDVGGRARITDFGVARALQRLTRTASGEVKGKLAYFAPEQARGEIVDRRTDVFAFGVVVWEVLAGRRLFGGSSPADVVKKVLSMPIPRLDEVRPEVPAALADAVARAVERNLDRRTQTAGELAHAIRAACAPAGAVAVGAFVREHGGDALARLESSLHGGDSSWVGDTVPAISSEERSGVVPSGSTPAGRDGETRAARAARRDRGDDATTTPRSARTPTSPIDDEAPSPPSMTTEELTLDVLDPTGTRTPPAAPTLPDASRGSDDALASSPALAVGPTPSGPRLGGLAMASLVVVGVVVLLGAWWTWRSGESPPTTDVPHATLTAPPPAAPEPPARDVAPPPASAIVERVSAPALPPSSVAPERSARPPRSATRRSSALPSDTPPATSATEPLAPAPPSSTASSTDHGAETRRRGALHGMDEFDRP